MAKKINWQEIEESNLLILKEAETIKIKFLSNGTIEDYELDSGDIVDKYEWNVLDLNDGEEKVWSTLGKRAVYQLKKYNPLKDKSFSINKFRFGTDEYDVNYKIIALD